MQKPVIFLVLIIILLPLVALSIDLSQYSYPKSVWQELNLIYHSDFSGELTDSSKVGYYINTSANFTRKYWSDKNRYNFYHQTSGGFNRSDPNTRSYFNQYDQVTLDHYHTMSNDWFGRFNASFQYSYDRYRYSIHPRTLSRSHYRAFSGTLGMGYGRVENATSLRKAVEIVDRLREIEFVSGDLTDAQLTDLANVIDRRDEFINKYKDPKSNVINSSLSGDSKSNLITVSGSATSVISSYLFEWYDAMGKVLIASGKFNRNALGGVGERIISEVLNESWYAREHGWAVSAGYGFDYQGYNSTKAYYDGDSSFTELTKDDRPVVIGTLEYYKPLSMKLQWNNSISFKRTGIRSTHSYGYTLSGFTELDYELARHIILSNQANLYVSKQLPPQNYIYLKSLRAVVVQGSLSSTLNIYIASKFVLTQTIRFQKIDGRKQPIYWSAVTDLGYKIL